MRTTVTLDDDTAALLQRRMDETGQSFKEALNETLRRALARPDASADRPSKTYAMGHPHVPLDKALQLAGQLEDEEVIRKMALGK